MIGGILFLSFLSVCPFVCLSVCLTVVNFNLRYNFWVVRDRDFIFGMHTPLMTPIQMTPRSMTLWPCFDLEAKNSFLNFVASGGILCVSQTPWFLVHLSRRLKCTIVITCCPSSVVRPSVVRPSVRPSVVRRPSLTFHIFDFSSETAERNSTKLDRKQDLNVLYQVCVFWAYRKTRWPPWPLIGWDIFDFSSETAERNSKKLDRKQDLNFLYKVCVFGADQKNKMAALASDWLRHFRIFLWNRRTEFNETWQEARSQRPLPSLCFLGRSEKQDGRPGLWLADTFSTSPLKPLNGIQRNLTGSKISTSSTKFVFFRPIGKTRWPPWPLIGWDIFDFSSETAERDSTKLDRKQDLNVLYQVCVFWADRKNKMAAQASDWLIHFRLLLWNRWTEFKETWKEARSQRPLPSLCFSGRSEKQDGRPGLWLAETFSTSPLKPLNGIQRNLTGSKISTSSTKFVFFGLIRKQKWLPWPIPQKGGTLYSGARYVALWASCFILWPWSWTFTYFWKTLTLDAI